MRHKLSLLRSGTLRINRTFCTINSSFFPIQERKDTPQYKSGENPLPLGQHRQAHRQTVVFFRGNPTLSINMLVENKTNETLSLS